ncbi:CCCH-type Zn-finger protein [Pelomyxa schiedti]|nr:CCCH-type Zn-finger protein [Pelomyxa schiedti]
MSTRQLRFGSCNNAARADDISHLYHTREKNPLLPAVAETLPVGTPLGTFASDRHTLAPPTPARQLSSQSPPPLHPWVLQVPEAMPGNQEESFLMCGSSTSQESTPFETTWNFSIPRTATPPRPCRNLNTRNLHQQSAPTPQYAVSWPQANMGSTFMPPYFQESPEIDGLLPPPSTSIPADFALGGPSSLMSGTPSSFPSHTEEPTSLYKTELCRSFSENGTCRYGYKCQFAHGQEELRPVIRHPRYKTEICKTFHTIGTCKYGTRCRFIHMLPNAEPFNMGDPENTKEDKQKQAFNMPHSTPALVDTPTAGDPPVNTVNILNTMHPPETSTGSRLEVFRKFTAS